jgi:site-specific recombinase XerC
VSDRARRAMVKRRAITAGVPKDGHLHPWRHPVGTEMNRQITDIRGVQKRLGHVDLSTTMMDTHSLDEVEHAMKTLYLGEGRVEE